MTENFHKHRYKFYHILNIRICGSLLYLYRIDMDHAMLHLRESAFYFIMDVFGYLVRFIQRHGAVSAYFHIYIYFRAEETCFEVVDRYNAADAAYGLFYKPFRFIAAGGVDKLIDSVFEYIDGGL